MKLAKVRAVASRAVHNGANRYDVLFRTHINGAFYICHAPYTGDQVSGMTDIVEATYGDQFVDVCYGAVSTRNLTVMIPLVSPPAH
ncbi:MAG: hypothetical protein WKH64_08895 [Chloroflexia bacterium]